MRKVFSVALMAAIVCLVGMTRDAGATVTFSLVWIGTSGTGVTGTSSIFADSGDVLELQVRMTTDQTLGAHGVSLNFDTDLGNELNLLNPVGGKNWSGSTFGTTTMVSQYAEISPVGTTAESTGAMAGRINTFNSGVLSGPLFLPVGSYAIGTARFTYNGGSTDGNDVFVGLFNTGVDDVLNNLNTVIAPGTMVFGGAEVNFIPEPGTASLLGLGLIGLVLAGRRARPS